MNTRGARQPRPLQLALKGDTRPRETPTHLASGGERSTKQEQAPLCANKHHFSSAPPACRPGWHMSRSIGYLSWLTLASSGEPGTEQPVPERIAQPEPNSHRWELSDVVWDPFAVVCTRHVHVAATRQQSRSRCVFARQFSVVWRSLTQRARGVPTLTQAAREVSPSQRDNAAALLPRLLEPSEGEARPVTTGAGRAKRVSRLAARPKICRVEGCTVRLEDASRYLQRVRYVALIPSLSAGFETPRHDPSPHARRICEAHAFALSVPTTIGPQRLCQKCNRLHPLSAFMEDKRCCDAKLKALRQRRCATAVATAGAAASDAAAGLSSASTAGAVDWLDKFLERAGTGLELPAAPEAGAGGSFATSLQPFAWPWDLPQHSTATLKLADSPAAAFAPPGVRAQLLPSGELAAAVQLHAAVRPGCTLLSLDAMVPSESDGTLEGTWLAPGADDAASVLKALLVNSPCLAAQARLPGGLRLELPGSAAVARAEPLRRWWGGPAVLQTVIASDLHSAAGKLRVAPLAALSTCPLELLLLVPSAASTTDTRIWLRINGQYITTKPSSAGHAAGELRVLLPPTGANGCAVVVVELGDGTIISSVLLLTADASVAAELAAHGSAQAGSGLAVGDELERAVWAVGCALALVERHVAFGTTRSARYAIAAASAAAAIRFGWLHSLQACIAAAVAADSVADPCASEISEMAPVRAAGSGACLLHQAVVSHSPAMLQATLCAPRALRGTALTPDASGATPLHIAALIGSSNLIELLCATDGTDSLVAEGAEAVLGWFTVRYADGATPNDLSTAVHGARMLGSRVTAGVALACAALASAAPSVRGIVRLEHAAALAAAQIALLAPDGGDASRIAKALLLQGTAAWVERDSMLLQDFQVPPAPASSVHALRATLSLLLFFRMTCFLVAPRRPHSDAEIYAALPSLQWEHWQSIPTAMCCRSVDGGFDTRSKQAVFTLLLFLFTFLPGSATRLRGSRILIFHSLTVAWVLVVDPCVCALRTYARYGAGLRQPWQGGLRALFVLASIHISTEMRLPKVIYFTILVLRGLAPLITRMLEDIIQLRILVDSIAWDIVHAALACACLAHYVKVQQYRELHVTVLVKAEQTHKKFTVKDKDL